MKILPSKLKGEINIIASKSYAHRLLICAALSDSPTRIKITSLNDDIRATIKALSAFGTKVEIDKSTITVTPASPVKTHAFINCMESGSTLRFMLPVAAMICKYSMFIGSGKLPNRPILPLIEVMRQNGAIVKNDRLPLSVSAKLKGGIYKLGGDISSQFVSGLMFALVLAEGDSQIHITGKLESKLYVDMTIKALMDFGIKIKAESYGYYIKGGQKYKSPGTASVEGDWSSAAFFLAAGALSGPVTVLGLNDDSLQPDKKIVDYLKQFGAQVEAQNNRITVTKKELHGINIDISQTPDLFPILSIIASVSTGRTVFSNCKRLRYKESDRLESTYKMLKSLGADAEIVNDSMVVNGINCLKGSVVDGFNDHRIVMSAAIASLICDSPVTINDENAINKSYPEFFEHFTKLGGKIDGI